MTSRCAATLAKESTYATRLTIVDKSDVREISIADHLCTGMSGWLS